MAKYGALAFTTILVAALAVQASAKVPAEEIMSASAYEGRKLLQSPAPPTLQSILGPILCFANQTVASATQFAGATGGKSGLPSVLSSLVGTSTSLLSNLETQLGVKPANCSATVTPPIPSIDGFIQSIFCSSTKLLDQLETQVVSSLPAAVQSAIQPIIAQLKQSFNPFEDELLEFIFNIKCSS